MLGNHLFCNVFIRFSEIAERFVVILTEKPI